jgi:hypothetical protein
MKTTKSQANSPLATGGRLITASGTHADQEGWLDVLCAWKVSMVEKEQHRIVETATEARQAEPGPSILSILIVSVVLATMILGVLWFFFFRP